MVVILGCGKGMEKGKIPKNGEIKRGAHVMYRLEKGMEVYKGIEEKNKKIICSGGKNEAIAMKRYLVKKGMGESEVYEEKYSKTTIENGMLTCEMLNREEGINEWRERMEVEGGVRMIIHLVTNDYHMKRSESIFRYFVRKLLNDVEIRCEEAVMPGDVESVEGMKKIREIEKRTLKRWENNRERYKEWYPREM